MLQISSKWRLMSLLCLFAIAGCGGAPSDANMSDFDDRDPPESAVLKDKKGKVVEEKKLPGREHPVGHGN